MKLVLAIIPLLYMASAHPASPANPGSQVRTPFPTFAPRASATLLYCTAAMVTDVGAMTGEDDPAAKYDAYIYSNVWNEQRKGSREWPFRLRIDAKIVYVAQGLPDGSNRYGVEVPFTVLNDSPSDFFAMNLDANPRGFIETLALNRVTGTFVYSRVNASIYGRNPYGVLRFEVCEPNVR